jgi:hypothetical protein
LTWLYPIFKILPIIVILLIAYSQNKAVRIFNIYVTLSYIVFAFVQSISLTGQYGLAILSVNLIMFLTISAFWLWETIVQQNNFASPNWSKCNYCVVFLATWAFLSPINMYTGKPDFNPTHLLMNFSGITFCMMTPVYLAILILYFPSVNIVTLRITSLVGVIIGFYNMGSNFLIDPSNRWFNGIMHIPLLCISTYGLIISLRTTQLYKAKCE